MYNIYEDYKSLSKNSFIMKYSDILDVKVIYVVGENLKITDPSLIIKGDDVYIGSQYKDYESSDNEGEFVVVANIGKTPGLKLSLNDPTDYDMIRRQTLEKNILETRNNMKKFFGIDEAELLPDVYKYIKADQYL